MESMLKEYRIVPVIKIEKEESALPLADALTAGGLPIAEITFRTPAARGAVRLLRIHRPKLLVGAGTILTIEQAQWAIDAGASFLVSPGFNDELVVFAQKQGIPIFPGVNSPTQVEMGLRRGLNTLKFFPAEASGGTGMIKALSSVYEVQYMPTGGITPRNLASYLSLPKVIACGGSWMVSPELITQGSFEEIERLTREALSLVRSS